MPYIKRKLQNTLLKTFYSTQKKGLILAGVVGCGKTTLINEVLDQLKDKYQTFSFTGDDVSFRKSVLEDTAYLHKTIRSKTQGKALLFVDEVQKSEDIFDAVKYAFDQSDVSFIISGSNPDYLNTVAKMRLQRRADLLILEPFSLSEILANLGYIDLDDTTLFKEVLLSKNSRDLAKKIDLGFEFNEKEFTIINNIIKRFCVFGGLPLVYLSKNDEEALIEIRKVVERGFESMSLDNEALSDTIKIELAKLHSKEFAYQGIFQKTGIRRRDIINKTIDQLINHGYLLRKRPYLEDENKRSYLSVFSFTDPGIVTYLTGNTEIQDSIGQRIEGMVHASLHSVVSNQIPLKSAIYYYKPYSIDVNDKIKFREGEIDFIFKCGTCLLPIETKTTNQLSQIKLPFMKEFIHTNKLSFGIVTYGGVPYWDRENKILYWPYWLM